MSFVEVNYVSLSLSCEYFIYAVRLLGIGVCSLATYVFSVI